MIAARPHDLSSIPRTHMVGSANCLLTFHVAAVACVQSPPTHTHIHTHTQHEIKTFSCSVLLQTMFSCLIDYSLPLRELPLHPASSSCSSVNCSSCPCLASMHIQTIYEQHSHGKPIQHSIYDFSASIKISPNLFSSRHVSC